MYFKYASMFKLR